MGFTQNITVLFQFYFTDHVQQKLMTKCSKQFRKSDFGILSHLLRRFGKWKFFSKINLSVSITDKKAFIKPSQRSVKIKT